MNKFLFINFMLQTNLIIMLRSKLIIILSQKYFKSINLIKFKSIMYIWNSHRSIDPISKRLYLVFQYN